MIQKKINLDMISQKNISDAIITTDGSDWLCEDGKCGECALSALDIKQSVNATYTNFLKEYMDLGIDFGSTTADRSLKVNCPATQQSKCGLM